MYYDLTDIYEGIDINKTNFSHECKVCQYSYYLSLSVPKKVQ